MARARIIFSPGNANADARWVRNFHRALRLKYEVLFVATHSNELELGAIPGTHTLHVPRFPSLIEIALAQADAVITGSETLARQAENLGVPTQRLTAAEIEITARARPSEKSEARTPALELCAVADHRYLPFLIGFLANLKRLAFPLEHFHLLALDEKMQAAVQDRYPAIKLITPSDLWQEEEWKKVSARGTGARAFASKPRLLRKVWRATGRPVLYSDLDIFYFESPDALVEATGTAPVLLFPQWNDQLWHSKFYGVFNAGMLLVQNGSEPFLHWWSERCLHDYNGNFLQGYYADQGFLDLAPVYFPEIAVYREGDHNLAYWNTGTLVESFVDETPRLRSGKKLKSLHAAVPDRLGLYEWKFGWDQIAVFFAGVPDESRELIEEATVLQQSEHWLKVSRLVKLEQVLHTKFHLWRPGVADFFLYSPMRWLLHAAARTHYHALRLVRRGRHRATTNRSHLQLLRPCDDHAVL